MVWNAEKLRPWKRATEQRLLTWWGIVGIYLQVINNPDRDTERRLWCHDKHCVFMNTGKWWTKGKLSHRRMWACHANKAVLFSQSAMIAASPFPSTWKRTKRRNLIKVILIQTKWNLLSAFNTSLRSSRRFWNALLRFWCNILSLCSHSTTLSNSYKSQVIANQSWVIWICKATEVISVKEWKYKVAENWNSEVKFLNINCTWL